MVNTSRSEPSIGQLMVPRSGTDVTVITYGSRVQYRDISCVRDLAATWLECRNYRSLVTDLGGFRYYRRFHPSGRVMHEGPLSLGYGAGLAARI